MKRFAVVVVFAVLGCVAHAFALDVPPLHGRVNDYAVLLTGEQRAALEQKLEGYEHTTGHQFVFLSVPELGDRTIETLAVDTFAVWKIGDKKRDDGLLFLVSKSPRKLKIEVGYGLEGAIPDVVTARIVRDITRPSFKNDAFGDGIERTFDALMAAGAAEAAPAPPKHRAVRSPELFLMVLVLGIPCLAFVILMIARIRDAQRRRAAVHLAEVERQERDREAGQRLYARHAQDRVRQLRPRDDPIVDQPARARRDPTPKPKPRHDDTPVTFTADPSPTPSVSFPDSSPASSVPDPTPFDPGGGASGGGGFSSDF